MRPIRWIIGTSLVGLGSALFLAHRELEEERKAHRETVLARLTAAIPPTLSDTLAATTTTAMRSPRVSTTPKALRPEIFFPASYPLVGVVTVEAPRTLRASMTPAEGSASRPSRSRTCSRSRSQTRSQTPFSDQRTW